jgi:hypothetical protein
MEFGQVRQNLNSRHVKKAMSDLLVDFLVLVLVIIVLQTGNIEVGRPKTCGIPIREWLGTMFSIFLWRSCAKAFKIYVLMNYSHQVAQMYDILKFVIIDGIMICWLVYGNQLFFSKQNNCDKFNGTAHLYILMYMILCVGYVGMTIYLLLLITLPILYCFLNRQIRRRNEAHQREQESRIQSILQSLSKIAYDPTQFEHEAQCVICMIDYQESDLITQLKCDKTHYFHTSCLESWIKSNNNSCPYCREEIKKFDIEDESSGISI